MANNSIAGNLLSQAAQKFMRVNNERVGQSIERVSLGKRINNRSEDSSYLTISDTLRGDLRTLLRKLRQAQLNVNHGISLLKNIEGSLNIQANKLIRLRELAVQSASSTVEESERRALQLEFSALREEIDRIASITDFNGAKLLDSSITTSSQNSQYIQIGLNSLAESRINLNNELNINVSRSKGLGIENLSIATSEDALNAIEQIKNSFNAITKARGTTGALQNRLLITLGNLETMLANFSQADSTILNADMAEELALLTRNQILSNATIAMVGQTNLSGQHFLEIF